MKRKIKRWKSVSYFESIDYHLATIISEITSFDVRNIIIWYAKKDNDIFNYFLFQYKKKYYELNNTSLKEIDKYYIFKRNRS